MSSLRTCSISPGNLVVSLGNRPYIATMNEAIKSMSLYSQIVRVMDHIATVSEMSLKAVSLYSPRTDL